MVGAKMGRKDDGPSVSIRNVSLLGRRERSLGSVLSTREGKVVQRVQSDGMAAGAGVRAGDVVVAVNGCRFPP